MIRENTFFLNKVYHMISLKNIIEYIKHSRERTFLSGNQKNITVEDRCLLQKETTITKQRARNMECLTVEFSQLVSLRQSVKRKMNYEIKETGREQAAQLNIIKDFGF